MFAFSHPSVSLLHTNETNLVVFVIAQGWRQSDAAYNPVLYAFLRIFLDFFFFFPGVILCSRPIAVCLFARVLKKKKTRHM